ncbi:MAG: response regulator [Magnetococcus sp. DMHC-6]
MYKIDISHHSSPIALIVDDDLMQRLPMRGSLQQAGFLVKEASNGQQALQLFDTIQPDIVLLDVMMPGMDGFATCQALRQKPTGKNLPILMVTGMDDVDSINHAYQVGATDFITKPINWALLPYRVRYSFRSSLVTKALAQSELDLMESRLEIIRRLGKASEFRDNETGNHILRMSKYALLIGEAAGLDEKKGEILLNAAPMHDVGKIGTPDAILLKPEKLTEEEKIKMREHTTIGAEMLAGHKSTLLLAAQSIALTHHERWDGTGYPVGLSGEEIPLFGRICAIADVFDALTSKRPYKEPWSDSEAYDEIIRCASTQFDPVLVRCFSSVFSDILVVKDEYKDTQKNDRKGHNTD